MREINITLVGFVAAMNCSCASMTVHIEDTAAIRSVEQFLDNVPRCRGDQPISEILGTNVARANVVCMMSCKNRCCGGCLVGFAMEFRASVGEFLVDLEGFPKTEVCDRTVEVIEKLLKRHLVRLTEARPEYGRARAISFFPTGEEMPTCKECRPLSYCFVE